MFYLVMMKEASIIKDNTIRETVDGLLCHPWLEERASKDLVWTLEAWSRATGCVAVAPRCQAGWLGAPRLNSQQLPFKRGQSRERLNDDGHGLVPRWLWLQWSPHLRDCC